VLLRLSDHLLWYEVMMNIDSAALHPFFPALTIAYCLLYRSNTPLFSSSTK
jgi:hypothetical protein